MEASQFFQRCLRHNLLRTPQCKNPPVLQSASLRTQRKHFLSSSRQSSFSTSRRMERNAKEQEQAQKSSPPNSAASAVDKLQAARPPSTTPASRHMVDMINMLSDPVSVTGASGLDTYGRRKGPTFANDDYTTMMSAGRRPTQAISRTPVENMQLYTDIITEPADDHLVRLRLKPTLGRTINLTTGSNMDLTRAFRMLEMRCAQNKVRQEANAQRTYVRRGQRRKIEKRKRWRALFQAGFLEECKRVRRMRAQGW